MIIVWSKEEARKITWGAPRWKPAWAGTKREKTQDRERGKETEEERGKRKEGKKERGREGNRWGGCISLFSPTRVGVKGYLFSPNLLFSLSLTNFFFFICCFLQNYFARVLTTCCKFFIIVVLDSPFVGETWRVRKRRRSVSLSWYFTFSHIFSSHPFHYYLIN